MFKFVIDHTIQDQARPNLALYSAEPYTAAWREFGEHAPYTVPFELINHCRLHGYPFELVTTREYLDNNTKDNMEPHWYPVQWGWFSFDIDYISLLPPEVQLVLRNNTRNLRILFYYHEGDNPVHIKNRLDQLCVNNGLSADAYRLVTGNTAADNIKNCYYFCDHELLYYQRNRNIPAKPTKFLKTGVPMRSSFLLLSRSHKWWRATVLTDLLRQGLLDSAVWSYNTRVDIGDRIADCPIELDTVGITQKDLTEFLNQGPYTCDSLNSTQHNDHSLHVEQHYDSTACSIILETHFDADGSRGAFLTEKTFKCLKHAHPFVLFAPAGTLAALRDMGYRTFDSVIDPTYDTVQDNTLRYLSVVHTIQQLSLIDPTELYNSCAADLEHNQRLFLASKWSRLNTLYERLHNGK
jgi:hypothetical protein